jgi:hypothetical protein
MEYLDVVGIGRRIVRVQRGRYNSAAAMRSSVSRRYAG